MNSTEIILLGIIFAGFIFNILFTVIIAIEMDKSSRREIYDLVKFFRSLK